MQLWPSCLSAPWRSFFPYHGLSFPPACEVLIQGETQMDIWLCFFQNQWSVKGSHASAAVFPTLALVGPLLPKHPHTLTKVS